MYEIPQPAEQRERAEKYDAARIEREWLEIQRARATVLPPEDR